MKIAFVIPWFGPSATGGAESECRRMAEHLQVAGHEVEVLTTCIRDFRSDWVNHYRPGLERWNGLAVRRFRADTRQPTRFDYVNIKLMHGLSITAEEESWFIADVVRSREMEDFIAQAGSDQRFVFIPYLFGTTYWGCQVRPAQSFVIPCLHDEAYAHLKVYSPVFQAVRGHLFYARSELELARRLYGLPRERCWLVGGGVDTDLAGDGEAFRRQHELADPFVLYAGRKDPGKNVDLLIEYFTRYKQRQGRDLRLVFIGSGSLPAVLGQPGDVRDLGFVSERDKAGAYAAASVLCNPSRNESFSIVLMEAWLSGTPALVHADCAVTAGHCQAANGGLYFADYAEFAACLDWLLDHPREAGRMGALGGEYVRRNYTWDRVITRLQTALMS